MLCKSCLTQKESLPKLTHLGLQVILRILSRRKQQKYNTARQTNADDDRAAYHDHKKEIQMVMSHLSQ